MRGLFRPAEATRGCIVLSVLTLLVACWSAGSAAADRNEALSAFVSILPQAYFVERVGGELVQVHVLVGPGQSPATYEPSPRQMSALSRSRLYFRIGVPFEEGFIGKIAGTLKDLKIVDTRMGVPLRFFGSTEAHDHPDPNHRHRDSASGGHSKETEESEIPDPHIWLDPKRVKIQAGTICEAFKAAMPEHAAQLTANLTAFQADLGRVDGYISRALAPFKGRRFYVFHPAFGYFADAYGLTQVAVEVEGREPSARQLAQLVERARKDKVKVIFVQPQFSEKQAKVLASQIGGAVVPMDPLARDLLTNLETMAEALRSAL